MENKENHENLIQQVKIKLNEKYKSLIGTQGYDLNYI